MQTATTLPTPFAIRVGSLVLVLALTAPGCRDQQPEPASVPARPRGQPTFDEQVAAVRAGQVDRISVGEQTIGDADLARLAGLSTLRDLFLEQGELTDAGLAPLADLPKLEHLRLRGTRIGDAGVRHVVRCQSLRMVNLPQADFTDQGLAELARLPRLELLRFGSPQVTDAGLAHLQNCPTLRFLHVLDTPITDEGLRHLASLVNLESLYLDGTQATDDGIERLLTALPNVHLHLDQQHHDRDPRKHVE